MSARTTSAPIGTDRLRVGLPALTAVSGTVTPSASSHSAASSRRTWRATSSSLRLPPPERLAPPGGHVRSSPALRGGGDRGDRSRRGSDRPPGPGLVADLALAGSIESHSSRRVASSRRCSSARRWALCSWGWGWQCPWSWPASASSRLPHTPRHSGTSRSVDQTRKSLRIDKRRFRLG